MSRSGALAGRATRAARVMIRDGRIPRPIRWLGGLALLPIPGPFDEAALLLVAAILIVFYRREMKDAWRRASGSGAGSATRGRAAAE
jgi:hypothetical protein